MWGFRSLKDVQIRPGKFNVLIGPNNAGKSNLFDSFRFLHDVACLGSVEEALKRRGSWDRVLYYDSEQMGFRLQVCLKDHVFDYELRLVQEHIERECLKIDDRVVAEWSGSKIRFFYEDGSFKSFSPSRTTSIFHYVSSASEEQPPFHMVAFFKKFLEIMRFYSIITEAIRGRSELRRTWELQRNGGNLAAVLHTVYLSDRRRFLRIERILRDFVEDIDELRIGFDREPGFKERAVVWIEVLERWFDRSFDAGQVSDGVLKLLAYITAVELAEGPVFFEEPENYVHPYLAEALIRLLRQ